MQITYIGEALAVKVDGVVFAKGEAKEYTGPMLGRLKTNKFFEVKSSRAKKTPEPNQDGSGKNNNADLEINSGSEDASDTE